MRGEEMRRPFSGHAIAAPTASDNVNVTSSKREPNAVPQVFRGDRSAHDARFAIVVSQYNQSITSKLLAGALETFAHHGVHDRAIDVAWVPGAWEIPLVADRLASSRQYAAVLCLGAVIRGETTHDQHINRAVSTSLAALAVRADVPVLFGILTCETLEQAVHRSGGTMGNKGRECAEAALEMVSLLAKLPRAGHAATGVETTAGDRPGD